MDRPLRPLITRNYAIFLVSVAALVLAAPFMDQKGWPGWVGTIVGFAAMGTMLALWLSRAVEQLLDWWRDDM
jgi:hypothetical protein